MVVRDLVMHSLKSRRCRGLWGRTLHREDTDPNLVAGSGRRLGAREAQLLECFSLLEAEDLGNALAFERTIASPDRPTNRRERDRPLARDFAAVLDQLETLFQASQTAASSKVPAPPAPTPSAPLTAKAPIAEVASMARLQGLNAGELKVVRVQDQDVRLLWCLPGLQTAAQNDDGWDDNEDQVDVTLIRRFWMMETEVHAGALAGRDGTELDWSSRGAVLNLPVHNVNHSEAEAFGATLTGLLRDDKQLPWG